MKINTWQKNKACNTDTFNGGVPSVTLKSNDGEASVLLMSDLHIGQEAFNQELFETYMHYIENSDCYIMLLGDLMEFAIPVHMPQTILSQVKSTQEQIDMVEDYFMPYRDRILFLTNGNHEDRQWKRTGTDISLNLAEKIGCFYNKTGGLLRVNVGTNSYLLAGYHGHSGGQTNMWAEMEKRWNYNPQVDLMGMGHIHHLANKILPKFHVNDSGEIERRYVHFVRTGSFLTNAAYAMMVGYPPTLDGSPIVTLGAKKRFISVDASGETGWQN